jgi:hypothetical protein
LTGSVFESAVYTWIAVFALPVNAALNPFLYTFSKHITEQVIHFVFCCFSAKHAALRRKNKDWLALNQNNVSKWSDMSIPGLLFQ